jgi:hypothetical protein
MKPGCFSKVIKRKPEEKAHHRERDAWCIEWQPQDVKEIQVRDDELVQWIYLEKHEYLHKDEQNEADDISYKLAH